MNDDHILARAARVAPAEDAQFTHGSPLDGDAATALLRFFSGEPTAVAELGEHYPSADPRLKRIFLPNPSLLAPGLRSRANFLLRGFLIHEAGHIAWTTPCVMDAYDAVRTGVGREDTEMVRYGLRLRERFGWATAMLVEKAEEIRIHRLMVSRFPGLDSFQRDFHRAAALADGDPDVDLLEQPLVSQFANALLLVGREVREISELPGEIGDLVSRVSTDFEELMRAESGLDLLRGVHWLLTAVERVARAGAGRLSRVARHVLETPVEPPLPDFDGGGWMARAERALGTTARGGHPAGDRTDLDSDSTALWPSPASASPATRTSTGGEVIRRGHGISVGGGSGELGDSTSEHGGGTADGAYRVATTRFDVVARYDAVVGRPMLDERWRQLASEARRVAAHLVDALADLIVAQQQSSVRRRCDSGYMIDPSELARISVGLVGDGEPVWLDHAAAEDVSGTAVAILIDGSASMDRSTGGLTRIRSAALAAAALHLALAPAGVPHSVSSYTTGLPPPEMLKELDALAGTDPEFSGFARVEPLAHSILREFDDAGEAGIAGLEDLPRAQNYDGEAVAWAADLLLDRQEGRKILLVLSDGEPSHTIGGNLESAHLRRMIERAEDNGVTVLGIGIQSESVRSHYPRCVVVDALDELPTKLLDLLRISLISAPRG